MQLTRFGSTLKAETHRFEVFSRNNENSVQEKFGVLTIIMYDRVPDERQICILGQNERDTGSGKG